MSPSKANLTWYHCSGILTKSTTLTVVCLSLTEKTHSEDKQVCCLKNELVHCLKDKQVSSRVHFHQTEEQDQQTL